MAAMKEKNVLIATSLLSILLFPLHVSQDIMRGADTWGRQTLLGILILVVWLYGTLVLAERRSGLIIMLIGGLVGAGMPVIHSRVNLKLDGTLLFIWTLFALGATGALSIILAARGLRGPR